MASDIAIVKAMADHLVQLGQLLTEWITEQAQEAQEGPHRPAQLPEQPGAHEPRPLPPAGVSAVNAPSVQAVAGDWLCPVHRSVRIVPAGVSAKTGVPYSAFARCNEFSCDQKPPRGPAPARAVPPSQQLP